MYESAKLSRYSFGLVILLLTAPLFRGGNRPIALMFIELLGIALLFLIFFQRKQLSSMPKFLRYGLVAFVLIPLIYLIPLPIDWWAALPGREGFYEVLRLLEGERVLFHSISINSLSSEQSYLALLPIIAIFLSCFIFNQKQLLNIIKCLILLAMFQAIIGLLQFSTAVDHWIRLGIETHSNNAVGTYPNRNHFSGLLEMILPLSIAYWAMRFNRRIGKEGLRHWRIRLASLADSDALIIAGIGIVILLLILGVVFSRSRTGIALVMLGILLSAILLAPKINKKRGFRGIAVLVTLVIVIAAQIGLMPIFQRFAEQDPLLDSRWTIYSATFDAISTYFPLGSGPGTYQSVLLGFQPDSISHFINHAHNDYLEWMTELGIFSILLFVLFCFVILRQFIRLFNNKHWGDFHYLQMGCGIGIFLMMLHSLTDYNLRIPANALIFSFLVGVFLRSHNEGLEKRATRKLRFKADGARILHQSVKPDSLRSKKNPFLDSD